VRKRKILAFITEHNTINKILDHRNKNSAVAPSKPKTLERRIKLPEIGRCYPVGENPTRLKLSQQAGRDAHVLLSNGGAKLCGTSVQAV